jgi:hypothetical protein
MPKAEKKSATDVETFVPPQVQVRTVHGDDVNVPKITWKKEIKLIGIIQQCLDLVAEEITRINPQTGQPNFVNIVNKVLQFAPEKVSEFVATVLDHDPVWVEDNLDSAEIMGVIVPLLKGRLELVNEKLKPYLQTVVPQAALNVSPEDRTDSSKTIQ